VSLINHQRFKFKQNTYPSRNGRFIVSSCEGFPPYAVGVRTKEVARVAEKSSLPI